MERFKDAIANSDARFKVIMNELPIQQYYILPYDRWEGYEAERQEMLSFLRDRGIKNTIFLTTDVHATLVNDARFQTLESGGPREQSFLPGCSVQNIETTVARTDVNTPAGYRWRRIDAATSSKVPDFLPGCPVERPDELVSAAENDPIVEKG